MHSERFARLVSASLVAVFALACFTIPQAARAFEEAGQAKVDIPVAATAPAIDGTLHDPAWQSAVKLDLGWDLRNNRRAVQKTTAYLAQDARAIYIAFDVEQRGEVVATQRTNDVGMDTDDEVQIDLWPGGQGGIRYIFIATPLGTHYQLSSENTAFAPTWTSVGTIHPGGFVVTMRIPLAVLRGDGRKNWQMQLIRLVARTSEEFVWAHRTGQVDHNDALYAGTISGVQGSAARRVPLPRVGLYGLGSAGAPSAGGLTSRMGADLAIPITPQTSLVGTIHPDYSNVEKDQQSISPTVFRRFNQEVRPFFTQGQNYYNPFDCEVCPGITSLYSPAIPTPNRGYAIEGKEGVMTFAGFDAIGTGRSDLAQSIVFQSKPQTFQLGYQGVSSLAPFSNDRTNEIGAFARDGKHIFGYARYGVERGDFVTDPSQANYLSMGAAYSGKDDYFGGSYSRIGSQYNPVDGLFQQPGISGIGTDFDHTFRFKPSKLLKTFEVNEFFERYNGVDGHIGRSSEDLAFTLTSGNARWATQFDTGGQFIQRGDGVVSPVTEVGIALTYLPGYSTPSSIVFNRGHFGDGYLYSWQRTGTMHVAKRATLLLEADDTTQFEHGRVDTQWLERASYSFQANQTSSFSIGARKIIGTGLTLDSTRGAYTNATNLSAAFSIRRPHSEYYLVYGDSSVLSTVPALIFKYILYLGAEKGS